MPPLALVCIAALALVPIVVAVILAREIVITQTDDDAFRAERTAREFSRSPQAHRLATTLVQANLRVRDWEFLLLVGTAALLFALMLTAIFGNLLGLVIGPVLVISVSWVFVTVRVRRRSTLFEVELLDALLTLRSALRAGSSLPQALATIARTTPPPCGEEFQRVIRETELGMPMDRALANMVDRNSSEDLALLVVAVQVHREVGGSLSQIIDRIAAVVQDRLRIKGEVRVLTAQPRMSGTALALMPIALLLLLTLVNPGYLNPMFNSHLGLFLVGMSVLMLPVGYAAMRRIARVDFY